MARKQGNSRKTGLEQYYTNPDIAKFCTDISMEFINKDDLLLEPCGGTGEFVERFMLTDNKFDAFDIEPKHEYVKLQNYLQIEDLDYRTGFSIITNPPFGRMNKLSVDFFNHSAKLGANYICFLIPISWRKWSTQNRLNKNYHLVKDVDLPDEILFYGEDVDTTKPNILKCIFQIWELRSTKRLKIKHENKDLISASPQEADIRIVQQGWSTGKVLREFDRTKKVAGTMNYKATEEVIKALERFDEEDAYKEFKENTAYVDSISYSEICYLLNRR